MDWDALRAPIPRDKVHWRAQTLTRSGDKALALAYIDARDLMERLDEVCGPCGWQDSYEETPKGRVLCTIVIRTDDGEWVSKTDGAGDTDVEGDKGAISDAFKRAGVKWGVARELYDLGSVWAPCEVSEFNGKKKWKSWTDDPWKYVKGQTPPPAKADHEAKAKATAAASHYADDVVARLQTAADDIAAAIILQNEQAKIARVQSGYPDLFKRIETAAANAGAPMRKVA